MNLCPLRSSSHILWSQRCPIPQDPTKSKHPQTKWPAVDSIKSSSASPHVPPDTVLASQEAAALLFFHPRHPGGGDTPSPCAQANDRQEKPCANLEARDNHNDDPTVSLAENDCLYHRRRTCHRGSLLSWKESDHWECSHLIIFSDGTHSRWYTPQRSGTAQRVDCLAISWPH
ncbi:MAG: hypothetical protein Q9169_001890 [Polycauliona sp. 2 TL-2023]